MTDGHTKEGSYKVTLELTGDMVKQLTRLIGVAKLMDGRQFDFGRRPETMDIIAYRAFLEDILRILCEALEKEYNRSGAKTRRGIA